MSTHTRFRGALVAGGGVCSSAASVSSENIVVGLEVVGEDFMHVVVSGNNKAFSRQVAELGLQLKTLETGEAYPEYFRTMANVQLNEEANIEQLFKILAGQAGFAGSPVILRTEASTINSDKLLALIEKLKACRNFSIDF